MKFRLLLVAAVLAVAACAKVTQANFARIVDGMSEQDVSALLGTPTESNSVNILGVSGTASRWASDEAAITVRFVNGRVALKTFDQPPAK